MVLTQQVARYDVVTHDYTFPYHYGSHATYVTYLFIKALMTVSIPLWFSRNGNRNRLLLIHVYVSIPLWFSRNEKDHGLELYTLSEFPYHYGSHATIIESML